MAHSLPMPPSQPPLLFLDLDDVLCINNPYGGYDVLAGASGPAPADLCERIWHPPATAALKMIFDEFAPEVVITSSWLRFFDREGVVSLLGKTGLGYVADSLHVAWEAPQNRGATRLVAVESWLAKNHSGQPFVVLDDSLSGTGLRGSLLDQAGCLVLCEVGVGLGEGQLGAVRRALK